MAWTRGRTIGRGSTAIVSIATADQSGHVFAVKSSELSKSESLRREQRILSALSSCPQIVAYEGCDISSENGKLLYNLFMEYAPSGTIMDVIEKQGGCLDEAMVRSYTRGILLGLEFLHSSGIVHCDIKGQNILVTHDGVKIADLGCAKRADLASGAANWSVAGTPVYMAPEVARGEQQGFPADVWALGCTIIEMATGRSPWPGFSDPVSALYRIGFSCDVPEIPSNISKQARDFLSKCLKRNPDERWSATELLDHDFVKESSLPAKKTDGNSKLETPTSVLNQQVWDSIEEFDTIQIPNSNKNCFTNKSLQERIQQLGLGNHSSSSKMPNWEWDETWVTVRSNNSLKDDNLLQPNCCVKDRSRVTQDFDLIGSHYYPAKISIKNTDNTSSNGSTKRRYKTSSILLLSLLILCVNVNFINDNKFNFPMLFLLLLSAIFPIKSIQLKLSDMFTMVNH